MISIKKTCMQKRIYSAQILRKERFKIWFFKINSEQLKELRRVKLSRVVCDNSDHIETVQVYVMVLPDPEM